MVFGLRASGRRWSSLPHTLFDHYTLIGGDTEVDTCNWTPDQSRLADFLIIKKVITPREQTHPETECPRGTLLTNPIMCIQKNKI